ncbi:MAG TPA: hypothetical protein VHE30_08645 [Polyangiaceae bacterium]|nr:hypothetical protein [Polyangiaceae bacterium]
MKRFQNGALFAALAANLCLAAGCSSKKDAPATNASELSFATADFTVTAGDEKYLCFTKTLDEDIWVDRFSHGAVDVVHHMVVVKTLAPEPEEPFECPTFFKTTWIPLFATGTSDAELVTPPGSSFALPRGTQLLMQLHLLNSTADDATRSLDVRMHTVPKTDSEAGIYGFGTTLITLPPGKTTTVTNDCVVKDDVDVFAVFPHMHTLGKSLSFELGPDKDHLHEEYKVDPWNFGEQFIAPHPLHLKAGDYTRTSCTFDNTRTDTVTFGESTENEMCFFTAFRTGFHGLAGCVELGGWAKFTPHGDGGVPEGGASDGGAGVVDSAACAKVTANELGIGAACTKSGGECGAGLSCTVDLYGGDASGLCIKVGGCTASADCGTGATCCAPAQAGGAIKICVPDPCRPTDCTPSN